MIKKMKAISLVLVAALALQCVWAEEDVVGGLQKAIGYEISGNDKYADGTPVADGESYALVWYRDGSSFAGFQLNGRLIDAVNNDVVLVASVAKLQSTTLVAFVVPQDYASEHTDGSYRVVVLDTRRADGTPAGLRNGALWLVNGWGWADASVMNTGAVVTSGLSPMRALGGAKTFVADKASEIPDDLTAPQIVSIEPDENGVVVLGLANLADFGTYAYESANAPDAFGSGDSSLVNGTGADVTEVKTDVNVENVRRKFFRARLYNRVTEATNGEEVQ